MKAAQIILALLFLALSTSVPASANAPAVLVSPVADPPADVEPDPYHRETPRSMQLGIFAALRAEDYEALAQYLEPIEGSPLTDTERAQAFRNDLDRFGKFRPVLAVSNLPEGEITDGLPPSDENVGSFTVGGRRISMIAERTTSQGGRKIWQISSETIEQLPSEQVEPISQTQLKILDAPLYQWLIMLVACLLIFFGTRAAFHFAWLLLKRPLPQARAMKIESVLRAAAGPAALYLTYWAAIELADPIGADIVARTTFSSLARFVGWLSLGWFLWQLFGAIANIVVEWLLSHDRTEGIGIAYLIARLLRVTLILLAFAALLSSFGINVQAGLAALGIGGLAVALGARKWVENLIGSISVISDKPIRVGDNCRFNGMVGEVLDIGLHSTRIRTVKRTLISIPNSQFSDAEIENLTLRDGYQVDQRFCIDPNTKRERIEDILNALRAVIAKFPDFVDKNPSVRLLGYNYFFLTVQINGFFKCETFEEGLLRQEELILGAVQAINDLGIEIVHPSQGSSWNSYEPAQLDDTRST